jgi:hypothetical protein
MSRLRLAIEPIPASSAMASLAKLLPRPDWDRIRRSVYKRAEYRCRICGRDARLNCHEVWYYNERTGYQWLMGFQSLCDDCHGVKHMLSVRSRGRFDRLVKHFMQVNKVSFAEFTSHLQRARLRKSQLERSRPEWHISFGRYSFRVPVLKGREQRRRYVELERPRYH